MQSYWRLSAYYFFYFAFVGAFSPYFSLYLQDLRFSATDIAILMSMMQVMRIAAPALWGWLADRVGARVPIVRIAGFLSLLGFCGFFLTQAFDGMLLAMALMAFFWSAALPLVESVTFSHLGPQAEGYGRIRVWGSIGFIVVVLGLGRALDTLPITTILWTSCALLAGILICAALLQEAPNFASAQPGAGLGDVLRRKEVRALLAACFLMSAAHGVLYVFYSIFLVANGYDKTTVGVMWTIGVVAEILVFMLMSRVQLHFSLRGILLFSFAAAVLRFLLIGWGAESTTILVLAQVMHGATFGAFHSAAIAVIHRWFPGRLQSRGQALYGSVSFGAGGMVGGLVSGFVWDGFGPAWAFTLGAGVAGLGWLVLARGWHSSLGVHCEYSGRSM